VTPNFVSPFPPDFVSLDASAVILVCGRSNASGRQIAAGHQDRDYMRTDLPAHEYDPPDDHAGGWWPRWEANCHARPVAAALVGPGERLAGRRRSPPWI
jgi:hypothetical protein